MFYAPRLYSKFVMQKYVTGTSSCPILVKGTVDLEDIVTKNIYAPKCVHTYMYVYQ